MSRWIEKTFRLGGIESQDAKDNIEVVLSRLESLEKVHVDVDKKELSFSYNPELMEIGELKSTLTSMGYSFQGEI